MSTATAAVSVSSSKKGVDGAVSPSSVVSTVVEFISALGMTILSPLLLLFIAFLSVFRGVRNYGRTEMGWRS